MKSPSCPPLRIGVDAMEAHVMTCLDGGIVRVGGSGVRVSATMYGPHRMSPLALFYTLYSGLDPTLLPS